MKKKMPEKKKDMPKKMPAKMEEKKGGSALAGSPAGMLQKKVGAMPALDAMKEKAKKKTPPKKKK